MKTALERGYKPRKENDMKTLKVMAIVNFVLIAIFFATAFTYAYDDTYEWADAAIGWGVYLASYAIAFSIVALVQANKKGK